jgi:hypothetical protein
LNQYFTGNTDRKIFILHGYGQNIDLKRVIFSIEC